VPKNLSPTDRIEPNATPAETLRQGIGTFHEINLLFAALVRAAGYSVFYVRVGTPDFRREILDAAQLPNEVIAVLQPSGYALFNLGFPYLSAGLLDADEEGQPALLATPEGPVFWTLPRSAPHQSRIDRQSRLALAADGSVSGRLKLTDHGLAAARKRKAEDQSAAELKSPTSPCETSPYPPSRSRLSSISTSPTTPSAPLEAYSCPPRSRLLPVTVSSLTRVRSCRFGRRSRCSPCSCWRPGFGRPRRPHNPLSALLQRRGRRRLGRASHTRRPVLGLSRSALGSSRRPSPRIES